ncbi:MAG: hypothetical protein IPI68_06665 [Chitinophagaceae bacterium]|nr:hypothetical protein [Chitinophagaceae bacterium]
MQRRIQYYNYSQSGFPFTVVDFVTGNADDIHAKIKLFPVHIPAETIIYFGLVRTDMFPVKIINDAIIVFINDFKIARDGSYNMGVSIYFPGVLKYPIRMIYPEGTDRLAYQCLCCRRPVI